MKALNFSFRVRALTLLGLVSSLAAFGVASVGGVSELTRNKQTAEWSAYSEAASAVVRQQIEQLQTVKWDPQASPAVDELVPANFPEADVVLKTSENDKNNVHAKVSTHINTVDFDYPHKVVYVEAVWNFNGSSYTNAVSIDRNPNP